MALVTIYLLVSRIDTEVNNDLKLSLLGSEVRILSVRTFPVFRGHAKML